MKNFLIFFLVIFSLNSLSAMTLQEALEKTYELNPQLKAEREKLKQEDERIMQALSGFLPSVSVSKQVSFFNSNRYNSNGQTYYDVRSKTHSSNLSVQQNIFNGFGSTAEMSRAKNLILIARERLKEEEQRILLGAIDAYFKVWSAQENLDLSQKKLKSYRVLVDSMKEKFKAGEVTKTNVSEAETQYSQAISSNIAATGSLHSAKARFKAVVGVDPEKIEIPALVKELPANIDDAISVARDKNPGVLQAKYNMDAGNAGVVTARSSLLPKADFQFKRTKTSADTTDLPRIDNQTVVSVSVPVFAGGKNWSSLRGAKRAAKSAEYSLRNAKNFVVDSTIAAWQDYEISKASLSAREDAAEHAKVAWESIVIEEQAGTKDTTDVIILQNQYFDSLSNLISEKVRYHTKYYALKAQLGEMGAKDLKLNVQYYDPLENYYKISKQLVGSF